MLDNAEQNYIAAKSVVPITNFQHRIECTNARKYNATESRKYMLEQYKVHCLV